MCECERVFESVSVCETESEKACVCVCVCGVGGTLEHAESITSVQQVPGTLKLGSGRSWESITQGKAGSSYHGLCTGGTLLGAGRTCLKG